MNFKKLLAIMLTTISLVSALSLSASAANTSDTYYKYTWTNSSRYDFTPARKKADTSYVYLCAVSDTLPVGGFYASTFYGTSSSSATKKASASEYIVKNYKGYTIRPNGTSVSQKNKWVRIRGHYANTSYTWGDAAIAWSPDTYNQGAYSTLN